MFKQSSRNQRSKGGFKVKHAIQLGVLLVVCVWLLHKVNKSDDTVEESITNVYEKLGSNVHEISKIGRKGLLPQVEKTDSVNENNGEEEDNQDDEEEEKEKPAEMEIHMGGVGDDEIDEHNQEHSEGETEKEVEEQVDENDKEQDENENEESEGKKDDE
ncbi:hypothetical protein MKW92_032238, partial [Papaver armeniacum]